jgi:hypothetical protein
VAQHEELDVLGGGRATRQQDQPEHLPEDQVQQPQRHVGIMSGQRSPLVKDPRPDFWHPTGRSHLTVGHRAARTAEVTTGPGVDPGITGF